MPCEVCMCECRGPCTTVRCVPASTHLLLASQRRDAERACQQRLRQQLVQGQLGQVLTDDVRAHVPHFVRGVQHKVRGQLLHGSFGQQDLATSAFVSGD